MKKIIAITAISLTLASNGQAEDLNVTRIKHVGPVPVRTPFVTGDTTDIGKVRPMDISFAPDWTQVEWIDITPGTVPGQNPAVESINLLAFDIENRQYGTATISIEGLDDYEVSCDGEKARGELTLNPATHRVEVKYLTIPEKTDSVTIKVSTDNDGLFQLVDDSKRMLVLDDMIYGTRITSVTPSATGNYAFVTYTDTAKGNRKNNTRKLFDTRTGRMLGVISDYAQWMPTGDKYYIVRVDHQNGRHIIEVDAATNAETLLGSHLPKGNFYMAPSGDCLIFNLDREGRKEDPEVYQVIEPEDRQPGWRNRTYPAIYPLDGKGILIPLTSGMNNVYLSDITSDGKKALLSTSHSRLEKRPTLVTTLMLMDLETLKTDTLVAEDGFIGQATFSPDGQKVLLSGTPEALERLACILPDSVIPSMIEQELFLIDLATGEKKALTRDFNPSVISAEWSKKDGNIYVLAENRDMQSLYRLDPNTCEYQQISTPETMVLGFEVANEAPMIAWWGQSESNSDRAYSTNLRNGKHILLDSPSDQKLSEVRLGECTDWNFTNSKGDTIYGRYYLPDNFDPTKKYPLIVNYYGGCSPTGRNFESRYPWHVYAQQGYVVYVLQPSGATGFGQEFSSRHVNTAGQGPAEDIIEGTKKFVAEHDFVNPEKIGCIGASYGGFMTQYLQTITDIFAAAVSHAGISDHTSYWGEGYWGYSYSEVSMAESYPWSNPDLYVKQSPLYNADKIHTPLLLIHGDADTNVPVGESIQMFTALKLLGRPVALVQVSDQDHHIMDISKRIKWQNSIFAWFAKYLQDNPAWWDEMYPGMN